MEVVFFSPRKLLKMSAMFCVLSLCLIVRNVFLIVLLLSSVICLSSFGVELRFCVRWRSASARSLAVSSHLQCRANLQSPISWRCSLTEKNTSTRVVVFTTSRRFLTWMQQALKRNRCKQLGQVHWRNLHDTRNKSLHHRSPAPSLHAWTASLVIWPFGCSYTSRIKGST